MANLKDIKTRIVSVKSTQKITSAMKMVATAKLRRAQENLIKARPYSDHIRKVAGSLLARMDNEDIQNHPLLVENKESKDILFIVVSADRGLCGAFNSNITRAVKHFLVDENDNYDRCELMFIGKKSYNAFKGKEEYNIKEYYEDLMDKLTIKSSRMVIDEVLDLYNNKEYKAVYLIYNEFKSVIAQNVVLEKLLPLQKNDEVEDINQVSYLFEPSEKELLYRLLDQYLVTELYRALVESYASEQGARMNAMESATTNADDMISSLTLTYNRARQSAITTELVEVISGAQALE